MRAPAKPRRGVFVLVNGGGLAAFQLHGDEAPLIDLPPLLGRAVMQPREVGGGPSVVPRQYVNGVESSCSPGDRFSHWCLWPAHLRSLESESVLDVGENLSWMSSASTF